MRYHYQVYGVGVACDEELPALPAADAGDLPINIDIQLYGIPEESRPDPGVTTKPHYLEPGDDPTGPPHLVATKTDGDRYHLHYDGGIEVVVDAASSKIWASWDPSFSEEEALLYVLGPALGFMLRLSGVTCLHAGGVVVGDKAFAIAGGSGAGKSTLVAACALADRAGPTVRAVLTDDLLPLGVTNNRAYAVSGMHRLRLFPKSVDSLPDLPAELPRLTPDWDKRFVDSAESPIVFHTGAVPLDIIYVLDWSDLDRVETEMAPVSAAEAVPLLAATTYRNELLDADMRKEEFLFLSRLVSIVPVRRVQPVNRVDSVSDLAELILDDFSGRTNPDLTL